MNVYDPSSIALKFVLAGALALLLGFLNPALLWVSLGCLAALALMVVVALATPSTTL